MYSSRSGAAIYLQKEKAIQGERKNERNIKENKNYHLIQDSFSGPSGGVSILVVHGFKKYSLYIFIISVRWRARLKEILVLTRKKIFIRVGEKIDSSS